jgi:LL-diaminopimelate aminotransferase
MMQVKYAQRLLDIPAYIFAKLNEMKQAEVGRGRDVIDLGIGDPDLPTPTRIVEKLKRECERAENHRYPPYAGIAPFREAIARWYERKFGIEVDPASEVIVLIGSKEGIAHTYLAFTGPGDVALCPDPAYPVYSPAAIFAGSTPYYVPLLEENGFLPDISSIPPDVVKKAKLFFINYPNNPTAAVIERPGLQAIVSFCRSHGIILCQDAAYAMLAFDGWEYPSLFSMEGGREIGIEFHSLSKTFNMTGWRCGFAIGRRELIGGLLRLKSNIDSGVFPAIQMAGIEALEHCDHEASENVKVYARRRDMMVKELEKLGWNVKKPLATFYLWLRTPRKMSSMDFCEEVLRKCAIMLTPGMGFGAAGEGYVRMALTLREERLEEAIQRVAKL